MDRTWLEAELAAGRSIESIARQVGRHPSTVGYWVRRHGLGSAHAARHAARGGIARDALEPLVAAGLTVRAIAERLNVSGATVRHWLERHDLETARTVRRRATRASVEEAGGSMTGDCPRHGRTAFVRRSDGGGLRCLICRSEAVSNRRRAVKAMLVREAGGRCTLCGYDRSVAALHFHHLDQAAKVFHLARRGAARSIEAAREEAGKCALLCANCHAEVENGIATIGEARRVDSPG